jgi:probable phosphoglycerate mutase
MKRVYFVRHGLSQMNVEGKYSGSTDTPLTPKGKQQAIEAGKWARENGLVFDIVLASPLSRAHETAKFIAYEVGYSPTKIIPYEDLKERHFGMLEGVESRISNITREEYLSDPFALDHIDGIEKITDLQYRANKVRDYIDSLPHANILIVSHGAIGRAIERSLKNMPLSEFGSQFDNAQIIQLI